MALAHAIEYLTYEDYLKLDDDVRYELIDGSLYFMAAPNLMHQDIVLSLGALLREYLKGKICKVYISPVDVRLKADKKNKADDTVVQPDVLVVCDRKKIDPKGKSIIGAPDLVIEVLSPSNGYKDRVLKQRKYLEAGVREYWVIDAEQKTVCVNLLENGKYYAENYGGSDIVPVHILEGFEIDLGTLFMEN